MDQGLRKAMTLLASTLVVIGGLTALRGGATDAARYTFSGSLNARGGRFQTHPFDVPAPGILTATLDWSEPAANLDLYLVAPSGKVVARATSTARPESLSDEVPTAGTWGLTVRTKKGSSDYALTVEVQAAPAEPSPEPEPEPEPEPNAEPTEEPSPEPSQEPSPEPTQEPSPEPTQEPTPEPTQEPSPDPARFQEPSPDATQVPEPSPEPSSSPSPSPIVNTTCDGEQVEEGANLASVTASRGPGTIYCLGAGKYVITGTVYPETGDVFIGSGRNATILVGDGRVANLFVGKGPFTVRSLDISGATGDSSCDPDCGRAFKPNQGMTMIDVRCHHNDNQCIGSGGGLVTVKDSEIDHNGHDPAFLDTARSAAGIKRVRGGSLIVRNSYVHDNGWVGLWCDFCEGTFIVEDSIIVRNGAKGISWEVSGGWNGTDHAIVRNNEIRDNNWQRQNTGGGITCNSCADLTVEGNAFGGNVGGYAIVFVDAWRGPWGAIQNVTVRDNALNGNTIKGCELAGVSCSTNTA